MSQSLTDSTIHERFSFFAFLQQLFKMTSKYPEQYFAGIDIGTSGVRCTVIDGNRNITQESRVDFANRDDPLAMQWFDKVITCLMRLSPEIRAKIDYLSIDGTSGSVVLTNQRGHPLTIPIMYNDARATEQAQRISQYAPENAAARGENTSLARALWLLEHYGLTLSDCFVVHQADFVTNKLTGLFNRSDENNALKLGYDSLNKEWPSWLENLGLDTKQFPIVSVSGDFVAPIQPALAKKLGLNPHLVILAGTTDSIAAFNATGVIEPGMGVTSLGSTLVVKMISDQPIVDTQRGVYSHRFNNQWLVGGASNCGAKILREYFTDDQLVKLSKKLNPLQRVGYGYYPLTSIGERFPVMDIAKQPKLEPRPEDDALFLHGLLEALAELEKTAYQTLHELGAPALQKIVTVGGGAKNPQWSAMRSQIVGVPVETAKNSEASYGMALLSLRHHQR